MAIASYIGRVNSDGSVNAIYCHNAGYLRHTGVMLISFYQGIDKVNELLNLGDLSLLDEYVSPDPNQVHTFDNPQAGVTVAYMRDRNEENLMAREFKNLEEFTYMYNAGGIDCAYLFDVEKGQWLCVDSYRFEQDELQPLEDVLRENGIDYENGKAELYTMNLKF
ncbi:hypothetical protein [Anaerorhabdus sp.]|uniref:hypothetical protein n=1 Tax=Anaerorhabdus sp. TaxID=1872524 RepID=UPI002FCC168F